MVRFHFTVDYKEAMRDLRKGFADVEEELPDEVGKQIAREIRQGRSKWRRQNWP